VKNPVFRSLLFAMALLASISAVASESALTPRLEDPAAVYMETPLFDVHGDGVSDDTPGWRFSDNLNTCGFLKAAAGERVYVASSSEDRTYSATVGADGALGDPRVLAGRGGESVAAGPGGNVYVANGQIFVYDPAGTQIARIDAPERPVNIVFGGENGRTVEIRDREP
jgi:hypothetical protein